MWKINEFRGSAGVAACLLLLQHNQRGNYERRRCPVNEEASGANELAIAREILRYLEQHPSAADTLDGIAQWWLLRQWTERRLAEVERALSLLRSKELILEVRRQGLPPYYQLNHAKQQEISQLLKVSGND
jgi:hypothetical protein